MFCDETLCGMNGIINCPLYCNYVCNNYLDLSNKQLSPKEKEEIVHCLLNQDELPISIRIHTADLAGSGITQDDLPRGLPFKVIYQH